MTQADLIELRAALNQLAKALETERACVLRLMHIVERNTPTPLPTDTKTVTFLPNDSLAGYVTKDN